MQLNDAGGMIQNVWESLPSRFSNLQLDEYIVMPNHFHGIIFIIKSQVEASLVDVQGAGTRAGTSPAPTDGDSVPTLSDMIGAFKSISTNGYIRGVQNLGWPPFERRIWQTIITSVLSVMTVSWKPFENTFATIPSNGIWIVKTP
jgi:hypothetical protein